LSLCPLMTRHFDRKLREVSYSLALLTQEVPYKMESVTRRVTVICRVTVILKGLNGQVLLQDQLSVEWTYGKDPYPPRSSDYL